MQPGRKFENASHAERTLVHHHGTSMLLPEGWTDDSQIILRGPEEDGFRPNLVFSREPVFEGENARDFALRQLPQLEEALPEYLAVDEGPMTYGSNSGYMREQAFTMERSEIGQIQFFIVRGGQAHVLTFTHLKDKLASIRPLVEELFGAASFPG